jgi:hypothetical protein
MLRVLLNCGTYLFYVSVTDITVKISLGVRFLALETVVDERYMGEVTGLMGNFDGNSTNDFVLPNGTILYGSDVNTERGIYNNFGQLCKSCWNIFHDKLFRLFFIW